MVNLKCFFNKIKIVTCKPAGNGPRDGRLPGKHIMIRVVNCIVPLLQLEADRGPRTSVTVAGGGSSGALCPTRGGAVRLTSATHTSLASVRLCLSRCFVVLPPAVCSTTHNSLVVGTLLEVDCNQITQATCFDKYVYMLLHIRVRVATCYVLCVCPYGRLYISWLV